MKSFLYLIIFISSANLFAQVAIAKADVDGAGILDFQAESTSPFISNKGLILPKVDILDANSVAGTVYLNSFNGKVEYRDNMGIIKPMTGEAITTPLDSSLNEIGTGVLISDGTGVPPSPVPGVLVLESNNKALILPKIANIEVNVTNPEAGMIVYDTASKCIGIYNGVKWSFWN